MLHSAAQTLEEHPVPLSAKLRQKVNVLEQEMPGNGDYYQMPNPAAEPLAAGRLRETHRGDDADPQPAATLSRMELRLQIHDRTAIWRQVCDGKFIWTESKVPDDDKTLLRGDSEQGYSTKLERVDVAEVIVADGGANRAARQNLPGLGGLPQMLRALAGAFEFAAPRVVRLAGAEVWELEGGWQPTYLAELLSSPGPAKTGRMTLPALPARMPDRVKVYLGKDRTGPWVDDLKSLRVPPPDLFPIRVVYCRRSAESGVVQEMLTLEVFQVTCDDQKLRPESFAFHSKRRYRDTTARFAKSLARQRAR
jgi:hypothetical protein